ncbi:MAG: hypothetical protein V1858_02650 [Candidatus Gottesmanbacteria bacterium]
MSVENKTAEIDSKSQASLRIVRLIDTSGVSIPRYEIVTYGPWFKGKPTGVGVIINGAVCLHTPQMEFIGLTPRQIMNDLIALTEVNGVQFRSDEYLPYDCFTQPSRKIKLE